MSGEACLRGGHPVPRLYDAQGTPIHGPENILHPVTRNNAPSRKTLNPAITAHRAPAVRAEERLTRRRVVPINRYAFAHQESLPQYLNARHTGNHDQGGECLHDNGAMTNLQIGAAPSISYEKSRVPSPISPEARPCSTAHWIGIHGIEELTNIHAVPFSFSAHDFGRFGVGSGVRAPETCVGDISLDSRNRLHCPDKLSGWSGYRGKDRLHPRSRQMTLFALERSHAPAPEMEWALSSSDPDVIAAVYHLTSDSAHPDADFQSPGEFPKRKK